MKARRIWRSFWSAVGSVSVRTKIMGIVAFLVLGFGIFMGWYIPYSETEYLKEQLDERGLTIARSVATLGQNMVLTNNQFGLYMLAKNTVNSNRDVVYVFITDDGGDLLVHTFESGFPADLLAISQTATDDKPEVLPLQTEKGKIRDVSVPILGGRAGTVHVGLDETALLAYSNQHARHILAITAVVLLIGIMFAYGLATILTRPISDLELATKLAASSNFRWQAPIWARDEIGRLGISFNQMMRVIAQNTEDIIRKNKELTTLNSVSRAVSSSLNLHKVLPLAMKGIAEGLELKTGWIFIFNQQSHQPEQFYHEGAQPVTFIPEMLQELVDHFDTPAHEDSRVIVIDKANHPALPLASASLLKEGLVPVALVPIKTHQRCLGVMAAVKSGAKGFSLAEMRLLIMIGEQIGVAVENSLLWEDLKNKENLRAQLLAKVISAQEEERKRIARELHDQTSQSITSLILGMKMVEQAGDSSEMKARLDGLRALATNTLEAVHSLSLELRPSVLDDLGLIAALHRYTKDYAQKTGLAVQFQNIGFDRRRLQPEVEIALYRVVQEALTNVIRHANAKNVSVILERSEEKILAIVEDDGEGFDVDKVMTDTSHEQYLGLFGMEERVSLIGGKLTVESSPGRGTTVYAEVPVREVTLPNG